MTDAIDELQIKIEAESSSASRNIKSLVKQIDTLSNSLGIFNTNSFNGLIGGLKNFNQALKQIDANGAKNFSNVASSIRKVSKIDTTGIDSVSTSLDRLSSSMASFGSMSVRTDNLQRVTDFIHGLGLKTSTAGIDNFTKSKDSIVSFIRDLNSIGGLQVDLSGFANLASSIGKLGGTYVTGAITNLDPLKEKLMEFIPAINGLETVDYDLTGLSDLIKGISALGRKSVNTAIENIPKIATALSDLMEKLSKAPKVNQNLIDMTNAIAKFARTGSSGGKAANSLAASFEKMGSKSGVALKGVKKLNIGISGLFKKLAMSAVAYKIFDFGKQSIEASSDLTEVQNVVNETFGIYQDKIQELASTSITDLGMSELTAKKLGSNFQAIGTAMGFAQDKMADMSVELTSLAGDMASFYNVNQEDVGKSLQSIFTGETEPMRKYGIDLTNATLQQYALNNGISKSVNEMTQLEKAELRYQYTMEKTSAAQGDFLRTSGTWSNQVRMLTENFKELQKIIGGSLINAFKPIVTALNGLIGKFISLAKVIGDSLGKIFGWKYETIENSGASAASTFDEGADSASNMAKVISKAAANAEDLADKLDLMPFDEMNKLSEETAGGGSGGGNGGGSDEEDPVTGTVGNWTRVDSIFKDYESELDTLGKLGTYIGDKLRESLESIDWDSIYNTAKDFGKGLADFLNGLISPELFSTLGATVSNSINTALNFLNSFGIKFDWGNFGASIGAGIDSFFKKTDVTLAADTINNIGSGILTSIKKGIQGVEWYEVGSKVADLIKGIKWDDLLSDVGKTIWAAINAGLDTWRGLFGIDKISGRLDSVSDELKLDNLKNAIKSFGETLKPLVSGFGQGFFDALDFLANTALPGALDASSTALSGITSVIKKIPSDVLEAIGSALGTFVVSLGALKGMETVVAIVKNTGTALVNLVTGVSSGGLTSIATALAALAGGMNSLINSGFFADDTVKAAITNCDQIIKHSQEVRESVKEALDTATGEDTDIDAKVSVLKTLADEYFNLANNTGKTAEQTERQKTVYEQLSEELPGFSDIVDDTSTSYSDQKTAVDDLITSTENLWKTQAAETFMKDYYTRLFELEVELHKNKEAQDELVDSHDNLLDKTALMGNGFGNLTTIADGSQKKMHELKEEEDALNEQMEDLKATGAAYNAVLEESGIDMGEFSSLTGEASVNTEKLDAATESATENTSNLGEAVDGTAKKVSGTGGKFGELNSAMENTATSGEKASLTYEQIKSALTTMQKDGLIPSNEHMQALTATLDAQESSGASAEEAWGALTSEMNAMSLSVDDANKALGTDFTAAAGDAVDVAEDFGDAVEEIADTEVTATIEAEADTKTASSDIATLKTDAEKDPISIKANMKLGKGLTEKELTFDAVAKFTSRVMNLTKADRTFGAWADFIYKNMGLSKTQRTFSSWADFKARINDLDKSQTTFGAIAKFTKRIVDLDQSERIFGAVAKFTSIINSLTGKQTTINSTANFTEKKDNIRDRAIYNIVAYASRLEKQNGLSITLTAVFSALFNGLKLIFSKNGGVFTNGGVKPITAFAGGGLPGEGQMFVAREAGPELVGTLGNHTAVMNNDQIVASVSAGVYQAVRAAMAETKGNQSMQVNVVLEGDAKSLFRVVKRENDRIVLATGQPALLT